MGPQWSQLETDSYQDHVIAHVLGATALGYFEYDQAAHILLDIGFVWTIYVDGQMALVLQSLAINDFGFDEGDRARMFDDVQSLQSDVGNNNQLSRLVRAPANSLIKEVGIYSDGERRLILITCDESRLVITGSPATGEIQIMPEPSQSGCA